MVHSSPSILFVLGVEFAFLEVAVLLGLGSTVFDFRLALRLDGVFKFCRNEHFSPQVCARHTAFLEDSKFRFSEDGKR